MKNQGQGVIHVDLSVPLFLKTYEIVQLDSWASSLNSCRKGTIFLKDFIYLFMRDTEREREAETQAEGEAGPTQGPDMGLDPRSPGSRPGSKAALNR